jgi:hypothetical protein
MSMIESQNNLMVRCAAVAALVGCVVAGAGCNIARGIGALAQNEEYQKLVDTPPRYNGLENKTIAVVVDTDLATLYEHPMLTATITDGISRRLQRDVPGAKVLASQHVIDWQYRTPQWNALPLGEITQQLNVDRVVYIDLIEYRLNPPGNRWMWEGVAAGRIGVIERSGLQPDAFVESFDLTAKFPTISGVDRNAANADQIETGLLAEFIKHTSWLFHQHLEPKYPDKYRPELDRPNQKKVR